MAATDDYIHSEEFNVRGSASSSKIQQKKMKRLAKQASTGASTGTDLDNQEGDGSSSMGSSWSLLDRRINASKTQGAASLSVASSQENFVSDDGSAESPGPSFAEPKYIKPLSSSQSQPVHSKQERSLKKKTSMPLLSVVVNALDNNPTTRDASSAISSAANSVAWSANESSSENDGSTDNDDSCSSNGDSIDDAEDPIMSMIRNDTATSASNANFPTTKIKTKNYKKKKASRLLDDLDRRLLLEGTSERRPQEPSPKEHDQPQPSTFQFGNWAKSVMATQVNRVFRREGTILPIIATISSPPPLARARTKTSNISEEEEVHVAASSSVLGDEELAQLANMKKPGFMQKMSHLLDSMQQNRHFLFVLFTLLLALFTYFYSRRSQEQDQIF